jgi:dUTP pyrophosphatase
MQIQLLSERATVPVHSEGDAGYDLASAVDMNIPSGEFRVVCTDIAMAIPSGYYGRIAPRSGLASKKGINVHAGVIDSGYRGNIGCLLMNHGKEAFEIKQGDRIAQLIITQIATPVLEIVEKLSDTDRGSKGYGSSGV